MKTFFLFDQSFPVQKKIGIVMVRMRYRISGDHEVPELARGLPDNGKRLAMEAMLECEDIGELLAKHEQQLAADG